MTSIYNLKDLRTYLQSSDTKKGCLIDTSILFSLTYPLDIFNEHTEEAFKILAEFEVPIYTNVNIRLEFIELYRRVTIPEALIDLLEDASEDLNPTVSLKLKSLRTNYRRALQNSRAFKLSDHEIKKIRELFLKFDEGGKNAWYEFCQTYLKGAVQSPWDNIVSLWNLNFLSLRSTETHSLIQNEINWEGMVNLVEDFGIGTSDAMILNLFQNSKLNMLITADSDLVYGAKHLNLQNKTLFVPDSL